MYYIMYNIRNFIYFFFLEMWVLDNQLYSSDLQFDLYKFLNFIKMFQFALTSQSKQRTWTLLSRNTLQRIKDWISA